MTVTLAWTTVLVIVFILPGVAFLIGIAFPERHAREVVRTSAIGDIGLAVFTALILHVVTLCVAALFGFSLRGVIRALLLFEDPSAAALRISIATKWTLKLAVYVIFTALVGFGIGTAVARLVISGRLRFLATHRWVYDVIKFGTDRRGIVTAYVLTTKVENGRALMYKGALSEFFLNPNGQIAYLVLRNCRRFFMRFDAEAPTTTDNVSIFDGATGAQTAPDWNYLLIQGDAIANVLFEKSEAIEVEPRGRDALNRALDEMRHG